ncbi:hypothetical protein T10_3389 [Trichinella papuae]|uniref:Peptidase aspartic putative domain-containing protein n=1 Tax=Trichinella papuae TaxID=268474 RepID=A0A0V1MTW2_9BILA|nr:hypothetical protein T10_3389 [Trichinella papuae]
MRVELPLKGVETDDNLCVINALCVPHICDKVPPNPPMEGYEHLKGLKLADKFPREEIEIDLLIGIDHYYDNQTHSLHCQVDEDCKCECDVIKKFWEVEAMGTEERNESEVNILERFKNEVTFDGERYMVRLPWKTSEVQIPNNYGQAQQRLQQLEKSDQDLYGKEMDRRNERERWYTRENLVFTTPRRLPRRQNESNRTLQNQILDILIRFRRFKIRIQADISKMLLQIRLDPGDKDVSRFLWRNLEQDREPRIFRFNRVTFGLNCSPFLGDGCTTPPRKFEAS